jgi:hypothetical protein
VTTEEADDLRRREVVALETIAARPVLLTNALMTVAWHADSKAWVSPDEYARLCNL